MRILEKVYVFTTSLKNSFISKSYFRLSFLWPSFLWILAPKKHIKSLQEMLNTQGIKKKIIQEGITSHNQEVQYTHDIQSKKQFWIPVEAISFPWYEKKTTGHLTNANISFYDDIYKTGPVTWEKSFLEVARNVTSARSFAWDGSCRVLIAKWISTLMERWSII